MPKSDLTFPSAADYAPVAERIRLFYQLHPTGRLVTRLVSSGGGRIVFRAAAYRDSQDSKPAATGWASEREGDGDINAVACLENTETSAIGRALANLGFTASTLRPSAEEIKNPSIMRYFIGILALVSPLFTGCERQAAPAPLDSIVRRYTPGAYFGASVADLRSALPTGQVYEGALGGAFRMPLEDHPDGFDSVAFTMFKEPLHKRWLSDVLNRPSGDAQFQSVRLNGRDSTSARRAFGTISQLLGPPSFTHCTRNGVERMDVWKLSEDAGVALFHKGRHGHLEPTVIVTSGRLNWWLREIGYYSTDTIPCV